MKRFATDVLRVLKSQGGPKKELKVEDFPAAFCQMYPTRTFSPEDYGLCYLNDLIQELVENSTLVALLKNENGNSMLTIPKREQTPQEMHKTRIFATEVSFSPNRRVSLRQFNMDGLFLGVRPLTSFHPL